MSSRQPVTLADKLNRLFVAVRPAGRDTPYSNKEVAAAIRTRGGSISDVYIWQLRTGRRDNPTRDHLAALAEFFDVSPAYFFDEPASVESGAAGDEAAAGDTPDDAERDTLDLIAELRPEQVSLRAVLRHKGLSPQSQHVIQAMVERFVELERGQRAP